MKKMISIYTLFLCFGLIGNVFAWDTETVHSYITTNAVNRTTNLDRFLNEFGLTNEKFDNQDARDFGAHKAQEWIVLGSKWEDFGPDHRSTSISSPNNRFFNHFFDPVNNIGLTVPSPILNVNGQISRDWANGIRIDTDPDTPTNIFSWRDARTYLYDALTDETNTERKRKFAFTFKSLGQVIHLLEDMSQPSHVRNDTHVSFTDVSILSRWFNPSRLEDWGKMNGGNVYVAGATAKALPTFDSYFNGLAAITNTNFFSDDTILKNYAMPSADQTDIGNFTFYDLLSTVVDEDGEVSRTVYITKTGGLRSGYKVAHAGYFSVDLFSRLGVFNSHQFEIDDRVAQENAQVLIPMAVEYSSGLLNYFFRGKMNMEADQQNAGKYIIKNESSEKMEGPFSLYYDDDTGNRRYITTWTLSINPNSPSTPISFTEPTSPAPKEKGKYVLVFNGKLGMEEGAVVGREVKLLTERIYILYGPHNKVFDPNTKEIKPYSGTLPYSGSGPYKIVLSEDGNKSFAYGNKYYYITDFETKYRYDQYVWGAPLATYGWRDDIPVAISSPDPQYHPDEIKFYYGYSSDYYYSLVNSTLKLPFETELTYSYFNDFNNKYEYPVAATSPDGKTIAFAGSKYYTYYPQLYYIFRINTENNTVVAEEAGPGSFQQFSEMSACGDNENHAYSFTRSKPVKLTFTNDGILKFILKSDSVHAKWGYVRVNSDECKYIDETTMTTTYDVLGLTFVSNRLWEESLEGCRGKREIKEAAVHHFEIMANGGEIIVYQTFENNGLREGGGCNSNYATFYYTKTVKNYIRFGGKDILIAEYNHHGSDQFEYYRVFNITASSIAMNHKRDKAVIKLGNQVFYIENGEIRNITDENPDFNTATFFTFIKE